jgi:uncharacterized protein (DUF1330 family)
MAAYLIFALDITDPESFMREYAERVGPTHEHYGGKLLVPGEICETLEGEWHPNRLAMLEFESAEQARRWYTSQEYAPLKDIRLKTATTRLFLVEGH